MTKINKKKDSWGQWIIYVQECKKFNYEIQTDMPLLNRKYKVYIITNRLPKKEELDRLK